MRDNEFEWNQFCKLGEMIGDGLHWEEPWISKEYKRLAKILIPPTEEEKAYKAEIRRKKNENINKQIEERLKTDTCSKCNSKLKQTRSGSKVVQCINEECKAKFQYKTKKK
jgi:hypothetical protein